MEATGGAGSKGDAQTTKTDNATLLPFVHVITSPSAIGTSSGPTCMPSLAAVAENTVLPMLSWSSGC